VLVIVTGCARLAVPTVCEPKSTLEVDQSETDRNAAPVPRERRDGGTARCVGVHRHLARVRARRRSARRSPRSGSSRSRRATRRNWWCLLKNEPSGDDARDRRAAPRRCWSA
jgi:hypothetical protein